MMSCFRACIKGSTSDDDSAANVPARHVTFSANEETAAERNAANLYTFHKLLQAERAEEFKKRYQDFVFFDTEMHANFEKYFSRVSQNAIIKMHNSKNENISDSEGIEDDASLKTIGHSSEQSSEAKEVAEPTPQKQLLDPLALEH